MKNTGFFHWAINIPLQNGILPYSYERFYVPTRTSPPRAALPCQPCPPSTLPWPPHQASPHPASPHPARPGAGVPTLPAPQPARSSQLLRTPPPATEFFPQGRIFSWRYQIFSWRYLIFSLIYQIFSSCRNSPIALMQILPLHAELCALASSFSAAWAAFCATNITGQSKRL